MTASGCAKNTDKEIWRKVPGDYYSPCIHVTEFGGIGINLGGHVIVLKLEAWHKLAAEYLKDPDRFGKILGFSLECQEKKPKNPERLIEVLKGLTGIKRELQDLLKTL